MKTSTRHIREKAGAGTGAFPLRLGIVCGEIKFAPTIRNSNNRANPFIHQRNARLAVTCKETSKSSHNICKPGGAGRIFSVMNSPSSETCLTNRACAILESMNPIGQIQQPEHAQVLQCLQGDDAALASLREKYNGCLANILRARGASATETDELLADMWGDCVARNDEQPSLLEKFSGKCSLQGWLATVTTRRWIDFETAANPSRRASAAGARWRGC
jgi:hypothetical protein